MITGPIIAEIAALVGDPARATMMSALLDGRAQTASELARAARITPQTASTHLAKLTEAGLLSVVRAGRHRHFRLASPAVVDMIDGIVAVALAKRPRYRPLSREARALDAARICYDHLAGRLSVDLTDALVARGYVVLDDEAAEITTAGTRFLTELGIGLPARRATRRRAYRLCLDWTERRPHIAGALGAAMTRRYFDLGWMARMKRGHAVLVTPLGRRRFRETFGIDTSGRPADALSSADNQR
jgi:DNA-binding transcriptional ArsR family regulator